VCKSASAWFGCRRWLYFAPVQHHLRIWVATPATQTRFGLPDPTRLNLGSTANQVGPSALTASIKRSDARRHDVL